MMNPRRQIGTLPERNEFSVARALSRDVEIRFPLTVALEPRLVATLWPREMLSCIKADPLHTDKLKGKERCRAFKTK